MILKIKEVGDEATVTIQSVEVAPSADSKMGSQIKFETTDGDLLYVGEGAVERQLVRIGVATIAEIPGHTLRFSRAANKNAAFPPYWNIDRASAAVTTKAPIALLPNETGDEEDLYEAPKQTAPVKTSAPALQLAGFADLIKKYSQCVAAAQEAWGDNTTDEALVAAAATLFIQRCRANV